MRALTYAAFGAAPAVVTLPDPTPPAGGAVVRVTASGLCRSDWHGWMGHDGDIATFPHVPGHELAGVVEAVADDVDAGWLGRAVTAPFVMACGACAVCRQGPGRSARTSASPASPTLGPSPSWWSCTPPRPTSSPCPTGWMPGWRPASAAGSRPPTEPWSPGRRCATGDSVLVIGCGGVGLAAVAIARSRGAFVCAVDVSAASLDRALFHGADEVVDASIGTDKVLAAVTAWSGGGVSVSIDALGSPQACRTGILALGRRGRHVQVGLLPPAAGRADVPMERVIGWELDVLGSHGMAAADYPPLLDEVVSGRLDLGDLLAPGDPLGLEAAGAALVAMGSAPSTGIVLVDPAR